MDPRIAEKQINNAINEDKLDFIMVNRALLADPYLPKKLKENKKKDIRPCTKCISCFKAVADMWGDVYKRQDRIPGYGSDWPEPSAKEKTQRNHKG